MPTNLVDIIRELDAGIERYFNKIAKINNVEINFANRSVETPLFKALWHAYFWELEVGKAHKTIDSFLNENIPTILDELDEYQSENGVLLINALCNPELYKVYRSDCKATPYWFSVNQKANTPDYEDYQIFFPGNPIFRILKTKEEINAPYPADYTVQADDLIKKTNQIIADFYMGLKEEDNNSYPDIPIMGINVQQPATKVVGLR